MLVVRQRNPNKYNIDPTHQEISFLFPQHRKEMAGMRHRFFEKNESQFLYFVRNTSCLAHLQSV